MKTVSCQGGNIHLIQPNLKGPTLCGLSAAQVSASHPDTNIVYCRDCLVEYEKLGLDLTSQLNNQLMNCNIEEVLNKSLVIDIGIRPIGALFGNLKFEVLITTGEYEKLYCEFNAMRDDIFARGSCSDSDIESVIEKVSDFVLDNIDVGESLNKKYIPYCVTSA